MSSGEGIVSSAARAGNAPRLAPWTVKDLVEWDTRIRAKDSEFGHDYNPPEFELFDHNEKIS
jgi:hypothetical protein